MIFLRKVEILDLHRRLLAAFGGTDGVLSEGALESALIAAENRHWYEGADLAGCAAAYVYHLTQAHAFLDGSKRVGAAAMEVYLLVNEAALLASDDEIYEQVMSIASGRRSRSDVEGWLRPRIRGRPG
jgi:death-on-curing protein